MVDDCHGVKWYDSKHVIDLNKLPSLQWKFTNQFGDPVYLETELAWRGLWKGYFDLDKGKKLEKSVFVWADRYQMYFISNTSSLITGMNYSRDRLRKVDDSPNEYTFVMSLISIR